MYVRGGCEFYLVPFFRDTLRFQQVVRAFAKEAAASKSRRKYLFFHQEIYGAKLTHGTVSVDGVKHRKVLNSRFTHMIGGHLHMPHTVPHLDNVHYVGSPFSQDWTEINQSKRYIIIDTDKPNELISVPARMPGHYDRDAKSWRSSLNPVDGSVFRARTRLQPGQTEPDARSSVETEYATKYP